MKEKGMKMHVTVLASFALSAGFLAETGQCEPSWTLKKIETAAEMSKESESTYKGRERADYDYEVTRVIATLKDSRSDRTKREEVTRATRVAAGLGA